MEQNKHILFLLLLLQTIANIGFGQDSVHYWKDDILHKSKEYKWADEVNKLVAPKYVLLKNYHLGSFYKEIDLNKDGIKELFVIVTDTTGKDNEQLHKIFVFRISNKWIHKIDSSSNFESHSEGPFIDMKNDTLDLLCSYRRGSFNLLKYKFNSGINKFELIRIGILMRERYNDSHQIGKYVCYDREFNPNTKTLHIESYLENEYHDEILSTKKQKTIIKKLPKGFSKLLSKMKEDYDDIMDEGEKIRKQLQY